MWPRFVRRWLVAVILTSSLYILASSALHIESIFQALFDKATRQWITQSLAGSAFWILAFSLMYPIVVFFRGSDNNLYGLEHAILNIDIPPRSMWMNMGYWEVCNRNYYSTLLGSPDVKISVAQRHLN